MPCGAIRFTASIWALWNHASLRDTINGSAQFARKRMLHAAGGVAPPRLRDKRATHENGTLPSDKWTRSHTHDRICTQLDAADRARGAVALARFAPLFLDPETECAAPHGSTIGSGHFSMLTPTCREQ
jgi:hypothetical protein